MFAELPEEDSIYQLSDAESRMAADGMYFKQQMEAMREAEEEEERERLESEQSSRALPRLAGGPSAAVKQLQKAEKTVVYGSRISRAEGAAPAPGMRASEERRSRVGLQVPARAPRGSIPRCPLLV